MTTFNTIGILALQGSVEEHKSSLKAAIKNKSLHFDIREIRKPSDMLDANCQVNISGIIFPGGESTTQSLLLQSTGLFDLLKKSIERGLPVWGTCAGAILLSKSVKGKNAPRTLGVMNIEADRNAYGSQICSFDESVSLTLPGNKSKNITTAFIRAPKLHAISKSVQVIATYHDVPVGFLEKNMMATEFHPELTEDLSVHEFFLSLCIT